MFFADDYAFTEMAAGRETITYTQGFDSAAVRATVFMKRGIKKRK